MGYERLRESDWEKPPWEFKIAAGFCGRFEANNKFGFNADVSTTFEDIWSAGGNLSYLSSAETIEIASSSANDTSAGTGAQKVKIFGVDANYVAIEEEVTLNGISDVTTTNSYLRAYRMFITDVGSGEVNEGNIIATATTSATVQAQIDADLGHSSMAIVTVPDGFYAIVTGIRTAATGRDSAVIDFCVREESKGWRVLNRDNIPTASISHSYYTNLKAPLLVSSHSDMKIRGIKMGGGSTIIDGSFSYYLVDEREINT